jgi:hypothetical protein
MMDYTYWNIKGINSQTRWDDMYMKIDEINCNIICLEEKKENILTILSEKLYPRTFTHFSYDFHLLVILENWLLSGMDQCFEEMFYTRLNNKIKLNLHAISLTKNGI